jgi:flagellar motor switch protein FliG
MDINMDRIEIIVMKKLLMKEKEKNIINSVLNSDKRKSPFRPTEPLTNSIKKYGPMI